MKKNKLAMLLVLPGLCCPTVPAAIEIGSSAPSCTARLLGSGEPLDLSRYLGKVVYLDFWATWCPPCRKSMPFLESLSREWKDEGLEVIAISVDTEREEVERFLRRYSVTITTALDPEGSCPEKFQVMAMPSSYLIDKSGRIRAAHLGFHESDAEGIRRQIRKLLEE